MRIPYALILLCFLCFMAACDAADPAPAPSVSGRWTGAVSRSGADQVFELDLNESRTLATGGGSLRANGAAAFTLSGSYVHPSVSLQFTFQDRPPISFTGRVSEDRKTMTGALSGAGFGGEQITLARQ